MVSGPASQCAKYWRTSPRLRLLWAWASPSTTRAVAEGDERSEHGLDAGDRPRYAADAQLTLGPALGPSRSPLADLRCWHQVPRSQPGRSLRRQPDLGPALGEGVRGAHPGPARQLADRRHRPVTAAARPSPPSCRRTARARSGHRRRGRGSASTDRTSPPAARRRARSGAGPSNGSTPQGSC